MLIQTPHFSLSDTLSAGQTFCWTPEPDGFWSGWIKNTPLTLHQMNDTVKVVRGSISKRELIRYLGLDDDPMHLLASCLCDEKLQQALTLTRGLRCVREPEWECTANFICSSLKQIPQIRTINATLRKRFGNPVRDSLTHTFPKPEVLASLNESELRSCGLGYRAKFLHQSARLWADGSFLPETLCSLETRRACTALQKLPGVGEKVAHCILLYAWRRFDAFPIDVWISRTMHELYFPGQNHRPTPLQIHRRSLNLFGSMRGLAQLHLFHYARTLPRIKEGKLRRRPASA